MSTSNEIFGLLGSLEIDNKYDDLQSLVDSNGSVLQSTDGDGRLPIHVACDNTHVTLRVVQLLLHGWPGSISQPDHLLDMLPIHLFCENKDLDEAVSIDILSTLIEASPESVQPQASGSELPIHLAARAGMSIKFLKILFDAYPESVRIPGRDRMLPIHFAYSSDSCRLDTVEYLLAIYPESVNIGDSDGWLPIHCAASSTGSQKLKADIIKYFLMKDPTCASKESQVHGLEDAALPLHFACDSGDGNLSAVQLLFDAYVPAREEQQM